MHEDIPASVIGENINALKQQRDECAKDFEDIEIFMDSNEDSDPDVDNECQLWNEEKKKKEIEELKRDYTSHKLRLCNKNGDVVKTARIYSQNKNNFPVLEFDKRSFDGVYYLSKSLKEKLDAKAKTIQEIYNLNQGINYIK